MSATNDPDQIRADIEETRRELGDTVAALSAKTDVKAQAQHRVEEIKAQATEKTAEIRAQATGKKDEILGRAREISPAAARQAATAGQAKARANPVPTAAIAAFAGGFLFGRVTKRRAR